MYCQRYRGYKILYNQHITLERFFSKLTVVVGVSSATFKTEEKMYLRKRNNKWQCLIITKVIELAKTFIRKQEAQKWALKTKTQLESNSFQDIS